MKKFIIIFLVTVAFSVVIAILLVRDKSKIKETGVQTEEINGDIASSNNMAMEMIISDLKGIERVFSNNSAIREEAKKLRVEAGGLRKEIEKIKTDEQRLIVSKKIRDFSERHEKFIDYCLETYKEMREKNKKAEPMKVQVKGVKEA
jgi:hypothetical protein